MENATKALLIAAAILIAILIISLSLIVYNMAAQTVGNINLSEAEITQFNGQFLQYEGLKQSGAIANAMLRTVLNHNIQADSSDKKVKVIGASDSDVILSDTATSIDQSKLFDLGKKYKVVCSLRSSNGLVEKIQVTEN